MIPSMMLPSILLQSLLLLLLYNNEKAVVVAFQSLSYTSSSSLSSKQGPAIQQKCSTTTTTTFIQSSRPTTTATTSTTNVNVNSSTQLNNFFKNLIDSAFENDANLSSDKSEQQLEGPNDDENFSDIFSTNKSNEKTDVQKRWLESQSKIASSNAPIAPATTTTATTGTASTTSFSPSIASLSSSSRTLKGAPINPDLFTGTKWELALYLVGTPDFDPSNSLYGSKVNISTRKDSNMAKDGFAIGADQLPSEPSTTCTIQFLENGVCHIEDNGSFTKSFDGEWILSDDKRMVRFSMDVKGYQRTVTTTGTIQNVYWSEKDDVERKSSATYSIGSGLVYAEATIGYGSQPGVFVMAMEDMNNGPGGILKVEKKLGVFGVSSKMFACGKFSSEMIVVDK